MNWRTFSAGAQDKLDSALLYSHPRPHERTEGGPSPSGSCPGRGPGGEGHETFDGREHVLGEAPGGVDVAAQRSALPV